MKTKNMMWLLMLLAVVQIASFAGAADATPSPPNFYVSSNMTTLCKGQVNYVAITVTDKGTPPYLNIGAPDLDGPAMQNIILSIANNRGTYSVMNSSVTIGNIGALNSSTVYLPVFIAANSSSIVSLGVSINYHYYTIYSESASRNLSFSTRTCSMPLSVNVNPKTLASGSINNLTVNVTNKGATTLDSISLRLIFPDRNFALLDTQPVEIDSIAPNSTLTLKERVFVSQNASSQILRLNISATYYNGIVLGQIFNSTVLLSSGTIDLTPSSITLSPTKPSAGSIFSVSFVLTNMGTAGASTIKAVLVPPAGFRAYSANSIYVGDLASGGQTAVTMTLTTNSAISSGSYTVPVRLDYLDGLRNAKSALINVSVNISQSTATFNSISAMRNRPGSSSNNLLYAGVAVVAVAAIAGFVIKKRKLEGRIMEMLGRKTEKESRK